MEESLVDLQVLAIRAADEVGRIPVVVGPHVVEIEAAADGVQPLDLPPVDADVEVFRRRDDDAEALLLRFLRLERRVATDQDVGLDLPVAAIGRASWRERVCQYE